MSQPAPHTAVQTIDAASNERVDDGDWEAYYKVVCTRPPRELLRHALMLFPRAPIGSRLAIDIGCGAGNETLELLRQGWNVLAIDQEPAAIRRLRDAVADADRPRLQLYAGSIIGNVLPKADLIWAGLSLPFVARSDLDNVWTTVADALKTGGRFAGDFFGTRDAWAWEEGMSFFTQKELKALLKPLAIEYFMTEHGARPTATQGVKRSHAFAVIARRKG